MSDFPTGSLEEFIWYLIMMAIVVMAITVGAFGLVDIIWILGHMRMGWTDELHQRMEGGGSESLLWIQKERLRISCIY